jgi:secondary thiamine-phosphate synthase enzyme
MAWLQAEIRLSPRARGIHPVTRDIVAALPELPRFRTGLLHVFILHTSAGLTINENADPDVPGDLAMALDRLAPETLPYVHTCEGPDDMPAHVKTSLVGTSVTVPVRDGRLCLGTWQGIFLCEYRDRGGPRRLVATLHGEPAPPGRPETLD